MTRRRLSVALATLLVLASAAVCVRLGLWQLERRAYRQQANARLRSALAAPPVELDSVLAWGAAPDGRRVRAEGAFDESRQILLAGHAHGGVPGAEVVTPLRRPQGPAVLVNRGWLPTENAADLRPAQYREPGTRTVVGLLEPLPAGVGAVLTPLERGDSSALWLGRRLDADTLRALMPYALAPYVLRELPAEGQPARPLRVAQPMGGEGVHLGYALQWFAFAALIAGGGGFLAARRGRR